jgi:hypothetical protein
MTLKKATGHLNVLLPRKFLAFSADTLQCDTDNTMLYSAPRACIALDTDADTLRFIEDNISVKSF